MDAQRRQVCAAATACVVAVGTIAVMVWLGVAALLSLTPFEEKNVAGGICLLLFATVSGAVAGTSAWFVFGENAAEYHLCDSSPPDM
jgi:hypothetical protein